MWASLEGKITNADWTIRLKYQRAPWWPAVTTQDLDVMGGLTSSPAHWGLNSPYLKPRSGRKASLRLCFTPTFMGRRSSNPDRRLEYDWSTAHGFSSRQSECAFVVQCCPRWPDRFATHKAGTAPAFGFDAGPWRTKRKARTSIRRSRLRRSLFHGSFLNTKRIILIPVDRLPSRTVAQMKLQAFLR